MPKGYGVRKEKVVEYENTLPSIIHIILPSKINRACSKKTASDKIATSSTEILTYTHRLKVKVFGRNGAPPEWTGYKQLGITYNYYLKENNK